MWLKYNVEMFNMGRYDRLYMTNFKGDCSLFLERGDEPMHVVGGLGQILCVDLIQAIYRSMQEGLSIFSIDGFLRMKAATTLAAGD